MSGGNGSAPGTRPGEGFPLGDAVYVDGQTGRRLPVRLGRDGADLVIRRPDGRELDRWPGADLRPMPGAVEGAAGPILLGLGADSLAALEVADDGVRERLLAAFPQGRGPAHRPARQVPLLAWLAGSAASLAVILLVLIPALAEPLARLVPAALQDRIGRETASLVGSLLVRPGHPLVCTDPEGIAALDKMRDRLLAALPAEATEAAGAAPGSDSIRVQVVGSGLVNAFAAPGGHIVLTHGIIRYADGPEAVAGVLAHEIGHVVAGDGMVRVMRTTMSGVIVALLTGDASGGFGAAGLGQFMEAGYSQDQERAADLFAVRLLAASRLPVAPFIGLFEKIGQEVGEAPDWLGWIATHPDPAARVAELRGYDTGPTGPALLTAEEWQALRGICGPAADSIPLRLRLTGDGEGDGE